MSKITDVGAALDPQFERIEISNKLRVAAQRALETLEDVFGKNKIDVGAINMLRAALAEATVKESLITQRPWVGLTHDERVLVTEFAMDDIDVVIRAEAKLKDKNT